MKTNKTFITLLMLSNNDIKTFRKVPIGTFPKSKVKKWQQNPNSSPLWFEIVKLMNLYYPNDTLTAIQASGGVEHIDLTHYTAPPKDLPAIAGYGCFNQLVGA